MKASGLWETAWGDPCSGVPAALWRCWSASSPSLVAALQQQSFAASCVADDKYEVIDDELFFPFRCRICGTLVSQQVPRVGRAAWVDSLSRYAAVNKCHAPERQASDRHLRSMQQARESMRILGMFCRCANRRCYSPCHHLSSPAPFAAGVRERHGMLTMQQMLAQE